MLFLKAEFKFTVLYKKKGLFKNLLLKVNLIILKLFKIKYIILYSKDLIDLGYVENYPEKYKLLSKYYNNICDETYYLERFKENTLLNINNYIVIHLDEKFNDILNIEKNFDFALTNLQKKINKKIFITSNSNEFFYYKKLSLKKIKFEELSKFQEDENKILCIEDTDLNQLTDLIENSDFNISCHSGFFVHTSLMLNKNTIDVINYNQNFWLNSWISNTNNYKRIYKSKKNNKKNILKIFEEITLLINE